MRNVGAAADDVAFATVTNQTDGTAGEQKRRVHLFCLTDRNKVAVAVKQEDWLAYFRRAKPRAGVKIVLGAGPWFTQCKNGLPRMFNGRLCCLGAVVQPVARIKLAMLAHCIVDSCRSDRSAEPPASRQQAEGKRRARAMAIEHHSCRIDLSPGACSGNSEVNVFGEALQVI